MRSALLLAGGRSERFGRSKAFEPILGTPSLVRVAEALRPLAEELIIAVGDPPTERRVKALVTGSRVVRDARASAGPIEGFVRGFAAAHGEVVLVAPCDAPLLKTDLYRLLLERLGRHEATVPRLEVFDPIRAVYRRDAVRAVLRGDPASVGSPSALVDRLDARFIERDALRTADPDLVSFLDVNRPEDLLRAETMAAAGRLL